MGGYQLRLAGTHCFTIVIHVMACFFSPSNEIKLSVVSFVYFFLQETAILQKLKFRLNTPTPYVFMLRFLKAAQADTKVNFISMPQQTMLLNSWFQE